MRNQVTFGVQLEKKCGLTLMNQDLSVNVNTGLIKYFWLPRW